MITYYMLTLDTQPYVQQKLWQVLNNSGWMHARFQTSANYFTQLLFLVISDTKRDLCLNSTAWVSSPRTVTHLSLSLSLRPLPRQLQKRRLWWLSALLFTKSLHQAKWKMEKKKTKRSSVWTRGLKPCTSTTQVTSSSSSSDDHAERVIKQSI